MTRSGNKFEADADILGFELHGGHVQSGHPFLIKKQANNTCS
jgi:hypothetical protein